MNELSSLRAFVKVVEAGSFAEAARQMGTSKSVVTKRVNQLEEHLQLELLQRSTRRLSITDTGSALYERSVRILAELDEAKSAVKSIEWALSGLLRVSCISSFTASYLAQDLCRFQQEHPELKIELQQHDRICDPVQEGYDVSIQPATPHSGIIESVPILPIRRVVVATPKYLSKYGQPAKPEDLSQHRFAHNNHVTPDTAIPFIAGNGVGPVAFEPAVLTNTIWMLEAAVLSSECMALMPIFFVEKQLTSGELVPVLPQHRIQSASLDAWYRRTPFIPMKIRILLNYLKQRYGDFPPWEKRLLESMPELRAILGPLPAGNSG
ncbi:MAG: LysR family transcriptional regulator [Woeseia sp.]|nr:LysR family transcriptional regulator [Woeseia sp.]MBU2678321.1 LysR family transcriptional regulator [Gammaproteobacteria bacterium]NNE60940.1 LysR family transcriptional regulator [Woeseia sp.]NNL52056.1 LysR family transcriptional regulator [Woeseiaceae bacterium]NNL53984.1 LysR family transcriptional regulator [Woeseia sp.]